MSFEENLKKLEDNVKQLENPDIALSDAVRVFEEGVHNTKECLQILEQTKGKILQIRAELEDLFEDDFE